MMKGWILALLALPLAGLVAITSAPTGAAAAAPAPNPLPYIGPDGVGWIDQPATPGKPAGPSPRPVIDIKTGMPVLGKMPLWGLWAMLGLGTGGLMSEEETAASMGCFDGAQNTYCEAYFTAQGIPTGSRMVAKRDAPLPVSAPPGAAGQACLVVQYFTLEVDSRPAQSCLPDASGVVEHTTDTGTTWIKVVEAAGPGDPQAAEGRGYFLIWGAPAVGTLSVSMRIQCGYPTGESLSIYTFSRSSWAGIDENNPVKFSCPSLGALAAVMVTQRFDAFLPHSRWGYAGPQPLTQYPGEITVEVQCTDGESTQLITASRTITLEAGVPFELPETVCPVGWIAVGAGIDWTPDGGTPETIVPRTNDQIIPPLRDAIDQSPDCFNGNQQCVLELFQLRGEQLISCGSVGQLCPDWASDPLAASVYQCWYGGSLVDLNMCSAYRAPNIGVLPNTDTNGNVIPYTAAPPVPGPGQIIVPQTGTAPGPDLRAECAAMKPPSFWEGFSPHWIYQGAVCAMVDVFVPRAGYLEAKGAQVSAAWALTPPGLIAAYVESLTSELPEGDGCSGPHLDLDLDLGVMQLDIDDYPLSACEPPMSTVAGLAKTLGAVAMVLGTGTALTRYVGSVINAPQLGA